MELYVLDVDIKKDPHRFYENVAKTYDNETQVINYIAKIAAGEGRDKVNKIIKLDITRETVTRMEVQLDPKTLKLNLNKVEKEADASEGFPSIFSE